MIFFLVCVKKDFLGKKWRVGFRWGLIGNKDGGCVCVCVGKKFFWGKNVEWVGEGVEVKY